MIKRIQWPEALPVYNLYMSVVLFIALISSAAQAICEREFDPANNNKTAADLTEDRVDQMVREQRRLQYDIRALHAGASIKTLPHPKVLAKFKAGNQGLYATLSENGRFMATMKGDLVTIKNLQTAQESQIKVEHESLIGVSDDGVYILTSRPHVALYHVATGAKVVEDKNQKVLSINFFEDGFAISTSSSVSIYRGSQFFTLLPIHDTAMGDKFGLTLINVPVAAKYDFKTGAATVFFRGPQPLLIKDGKKIIFEDGRAPGAQAQSEKNTADLFDSLSSEVYSGLTDGSRGIKSIVWAERKSGSGISLDYKSTVDLFTPDGSLIGSLSPFYDIDATEVSADGRFIAVAEGSNGPIWRNNERYDIWIYDRTNLNFPIARIEDLKSPIRQMAFTPDARELLVRQDNEGVIRSFRLR